ncbi:MAG: aryl-sulfate sulfotransferase [Clostridiales bacterium]|nr:aryl-sulfate sulfotransferase [Clostridiales bacterium]
MGYPSVFPTGTTIYNKDKAYNGYTIFPSAKGALLIDMNGNEVQLWAGLGGFPNKILPGGYVLGTTGSRSGKFAYQDQLDLVQVDYEGHVVWKFDHTEMVADPGKEPKYMARQHHDFQREGSTTGYYYPGSIPKTEGGNTLILTHENLYNHNISDKRLIDDKIIEVDWEGNILWSWRASDHFDELGFDEAARNVLFRNPGLHGEAGGDWMHINSMSTLGENKWYDQGDECFHPDNIIFDARNANILGIISKNTGEVVYRIGPDFNENEKTRKLGWIIGQHHFHLIPKGLPGEGDFLVFDNGGEGGYGNPNPGALTGVNHARRDYSRVLQFDPITLEIKWQYTPLEAGCLLFTDASKFYSSYISAAQRLPNGNTLITEGSDGRLIEVTPDHEIVWEYINPYFNHIGGKFTNNMIYRAYRVPYEWVPQAEHGEEISIEPLPVQTFRVPGAPIGEGTGKITTVEGVNPNAKNMTGSTNDEEDDDEVINFCVASVKKSDLEK